jgi:hypothetical protein
MKSKSRMRMKSKRSGKTKNKSRSRTKSRQGRTRTNKKNKRKTSRHRRHKTAMKGGKYMTLTKDINMGGFNVTDSLNTSKPAFTIDSLNIPGRMFKL